MKKSTTGIVAGALGLGLLAGGSTFALWSDSNVVNAGNISAGNLDVKLSDQVWTDVSPENAPAPQRSVAPAGVNIPDIGKFLTVPGDVLHMSQEIQVVLAGDNIAGELAFTNNTDPSGALLENEREPGGVSLEYKLFEVVDGVDALAAEGDEIGDLNRSFAGSADVTYRIETQASFDSNTTKQVRVNATLKMQDYNATLVQVRN